MEDAKAPHPNAVLQEPQFSLDDGYFGAERAVFYEDQQGRTWKSDSWPSDCRKVALCGLHQVAGVKVFKLVDLEELGLLSCWIMQIPAEIGNMKKLKKLRLAALRELKSIPDEIGRLECLKELSIEYCGIESLSTSFGGLKQLEVLALKKCYALKSIPETLGELSRLKKLSIEECSIESLPKSIGGLKQLEDVRFCELYSLESIPEEIGCLAKLKKLVIGKCSIENLPKSMKELKQLISVRFEFMEDFQLEEEIILSFSRLKLLSVERCDKLLQGNGANVFCEMLKMSLSLRIVWFHFDWDEEQKVMFRKALLKNGSITNGFCATAVSCVRDVSERNRSNHARAMLSVVSMLAIRRCRRALNGVPREIIDMLAKMLWITRCDVDAWMVEKERSEKRQKK